MKKRTKPLMTLIKTSLLRTFILRIVTKKYAHQNLNAEKGHQMMPFLIPCRQILFKDLSNNTGTNCTTTFTDRKAQTFIHRDRRD